MLIQGACHCGNISFELDWMPEPDRIPVRECSCSFCRKHGGSWTSNPHARLRVRISDPQGVNRYAFGTGTADFHVCRECGVVPLVSCEIDGKIYAVVNVRSFSNVPAGRLQHSVSDFEGESTASRLERRKRNWIARVEFRGQSKGTG